MKKKGGNKYRQENSVLHSESRRTDYNFSINGSVLDDKRLCKFDILVANMSSLAQIISNFPRGQKQRSGEVKDKFYLIKT